MNLENSFHTSFPILFDVSTSMLDSNFLDFGKLMSFSMPQVSNVETTSTIQTETPPIVSTKVQNDI